MCTMHLYNYEPLIPINAAGTEALKKWNSGHAPKRGVWGWGLPLPIYGGPGLSPPEIFFKYRCKSAQFGAF